MTYFKELKEVIEKYNEIMKKYNERNGITNKDKNIIRGISLEMKKEKLIKQNDKLMLPSLTPPNILFHIIENVLKPYRDKDVIYDIHCTDRLNNLSIVEVYFNGNNKFCVIAVAKNNCDTEKKIFVVQRYMRDNGYSYGIYIQEYLWFLLNDKDIISELDFNSTVNIEEFEKFICWDN